jgi:hypothetical protein
MLFSLKVGCYFLQMLPYSEMLRAAVLAGPAFYAVGRDSYTLCKHKVVIQFFM